MLTGIVITYNEEKNIRECLENLKKVADELIIIDTYSTDDTVKIAKQISKRVYLKSFSNDFAELRNYGLKKAKNNWVIYLDADELLSQGLISRIPKLLKKIKHKGVLIPRRNYLNSHIWLKHGLFYPDYQLRLFNKEGVRYINKVHEYPNIKNHNLLKIKQFIIHKPDRTKYNSLLSIKKLEKYTSIQSRELIELNLPIYHVVINKLYKSVNYLFISFIIGKGYKDGWNGFRAAIIYSLFQIIVLYKYLKMKIIQN